MAARARLVDGMVVPAAAGQRRLHRTPSRADRLPTPPAHHPPRHNLAITAVSTWQTQLSRGLADRDQLRIAAGLGKLATEAVRDIADYRLVPDTVDHQRARRQRHDRAVAALITARATGLPGPRNPWRADMLVTAGATASMGAFLVSAGIRQRRLLKQRPKPPSS